MLGDIHHWCCVVVNQLFGTEDVYIYICRAGLGSGLFVSARTITLFYSTTKENNNTLPYSNHLLRHHSVTRPNQEQTIDLTIDIFFQDGCCCILYPERLPRHRCLPHGHRQYYRRSLQSDHRRCRHPLRCDHFLPHLRLLWTKEERNNANTAV